MQGKYIASFVGFLPADAPELAMLVVIDEPTGMYYGGQIAAPVFPALMKDAVDYCKIARTEISETDEEAELIEVPDVVGREMADGVRLLRECALMPECIGEGAVVTQVPPTGSRVIKGTKVLLYLGSSRKDE
jgi:stage V sporulation protein D (sporulation-specific penicillin-binding protein)